MDIQEKESDMNKPQPIHCRQVLLTLCLYAAFLALGFTACISGPALVHVGYLYETDVAGMSIVSTCAAVGYLCGSFLCLAVFDRFNHELQLFLCTLFVGLTSAVLPWLPHLYMFYAMAYLQHIPMGFIDSCGQSYIIKLWIGHRFKEPAMQVVHGIWSLGAFLGPFIVSPFLVDLPNNEEYSTMSNVTSYSENTTGEYLTSTIANDGLYEDIDGLENIRYPYVIIGAINCVVAIVYLIVLCTVTSSPTKTTSHPNNEKGLATGKTLTFKVPMLMMQFMFYFFYAWYECIPGNYLSAFVIKGLKLPVHKGPLLTSVFWGALGIGRILGAPVSFLFSPSTMIAFNIALTTGAFITMLFASMTSEYVLWISVAAAGFGMSTTFASAILWTSNFMTITGGIGALFLIGSSCGAMSGAPLAGFLFEDKTHMWVVYLSLLAALIHIVLFTVMSVFAKYHTSSAAKKEKERNLKEDESEYLNKETD